jgi:tRNA threonylcarbamoyladenosine modification (KEOPS) complex  Pcc1 subunit
MKITCNLKLNYDTPTEAKHVFESVHIDDASFMKSNREQNTIQTKIETTSVSSMLHTVDDFLACIRVAENIIKRKTTSSSKKQLK